MFQRFDPPSIPDPGSEELAAAKARWGVHRRRTLIGASSASIVVLALVAAVLVPTLDAGPRDQRVASTGSDVTTATTATPETTQASSPSTTVSTPTTTSTVKAGPSLEELVQALQTQPFKPSAINDHLRVEGVGKFVYNTFPRHLVGSAEARVHSDIEGESIQATFDVFETPGDARAAFDEADGNFRRYEGYATVGLSPAVHAFCGGPEPETGDRICWFLHDVTTGVVIANLPEGHDGDLKPMMQAMLTHLVRLGG